ncbi:uncharacterized protein LOC131429179 [Malaya genurostris]|uniref:uncharacterized protein LOC131429179 n=1 Tax=Malaya genurostris TaxID=325434 RepID=UPI0026F3FE9F|nr:uncharacterized protein LOC131429179 [Malaya genurostris]
MLSKNDLFGIKGRMDAYLQDFLANRNFQVRIGGSLSRTFAEQNGVPQGSVLAVTLLLVGINSIFQHVPKEVRINVYADDIIILVTGKSRKRLRNKIQQAANAISKWADSNSPDKDFLNWLAFTESGKKPWYQQDLPRIDTSLALSLGAKPLPAVAKRCFNQITSDKFKGSALFYTDGSRTNSGTGLGVWGPNTSIHRSLNPICSVFSAEAAAIFECIRIIPPGSNAVILSDSLAVITALETGGSRHPFVQAIETYCGSNVTVCWIPGHSGIPGNENADTLAAIGRKSRRTASEVPSADILTDLRAKLTNHFVQHWRASDGLLPKIKGDLKKWTDRPDRREQRVLSRLRTGHTRITHIHYITRQPPPMCSSCNIQLTVEHILTNCPEFQNLRVQHNMSTSIRNILSNDSFYYIIYIISRTTPKPKSGHPPGRAPGMFPGADSRSNAESHHEPNYLDLRFLEH